MKRGPRTSPTKSNPILCLPIAAFHDYPYSVVFVGFAINFLIVFHDFFSACLLCVGVLHTRDKSTIFLFFLIAITFISRVRSAPCLAGHLA